MNAVTELVDTDGDAGFPPSDGLTLVGETKSFLRAWQRIMLGSADWVPEQIAALRQESRDLETRARAADVSNLAHHLASCEHCFWNGEVDQAKLAQCLRNVSEVAWQWRQDLESRLEVTGIDREVHVSHDRLTIDPPTLLEPPSVEMFHSSPPPQPPPRPSEPVSVPLAAPEADEEERASGGFGAVELWTQPSFFRRLFGGGKPKRPKAPRGFPTLASAPYVEPVPAERPSFEPPHVEQAYGERVYGEPAYGEPAPVAAVHGDAGHGEAGHGEAARDGAAHDEAARYQAAHDEAAGDDAAASGPGAAQPLRPEPFLAEPVIPVEHRVVAPAPVAPRVAEPARPEPARAAPDPWDAPSLIPVPVVSILAEPVRAEPVAPEPVRTEPVVPEPIAAEPAAAEPSAVQTSAAQTSAGQSSAVEPVEPAPAQPAVVEPARVESIVAEPVRTEPAPAEPPRKEPSRPGPPRPSSVRMGAVSATARMQPPPLNPVRTPEPARAQEPARPLESVAAAPAVAGASAVVVEPAREEAARAVEAPPVEPVRVEPVHADQVYAEPARTQEHVRTPEPAPVAEPVRTPQPAPVAKPVSAEIPRTPAHAEPVRTSDVSRTSDPVAAMPARTPDVAYAEQVRASEAPRASDAVRTPEPAYAAPVRTLQPAYADASRASDSVRTFDPAHADPLRTPEPPYAAPVRTPEPARVQPAFPEPFTESLRSEPEGPERRLSQPPPYPPLPSRPFEHGLAGSLGREVAGAPDSSEVALLRKSALPRWAAPVAALGLLGAGVWVWWSDSGRRQVVAGPVEPASSLPAGAARATSGVVPASAGAAREGQPSRPAIGEEALKKLLGQVHGFGGIESPELADLLDEEALALAQAGGSCIPGAPGCDLVSTSHELGAARGAAAAAGAAAAEPAVARGSWLEGLELPGIGVEDDPRVREMFEFHTRHAVGRETFQELLFRCGPYRDLIRSALDRYGLPADLLALPMAASGCVPDVESADGSRGLWQLSPAAAKAYHLRFKPQVVDERVDPGKSTDAAVRLIEDLHRKTGSWELALAAYRLGPLALVARVKDVGEDVSYWGLAEAGGLPEDAVKYVPKVQAFALILANLSKFRFEPVPLRHVENTAPLEVPPGTRLGLVARAAGSSTTKIRELNPDMIGDRVPDWPGEKFLLRVPRDSASRTREALPVLIASADHADECVPHGFDWGRQRFTTAMANRCEHTSASR